eukprot:GSChrysophyteH1.ASY1.ANO1.1800.1 assembled CDS
MGTWCENKCLFLIFIHLASIVSTMNAGKLIRVSSSDLSLMNLIRLAVPPLSPQAHKGQMGRIGIIGGSVDYTGAPYYAGQSSLKFGGDLAYIFCAKQAAAPIKMYSPELMVSPFYDDEKVMKQFLPKLHALVIGPGLGRRDQVFQGVIFVINAAKKKGLPLVIDADALWMLSQGSNLQNIFDYSNCILTPNVMEFKLLVKAAMRLGLSSQYTDVQLSSLAKALRVTILLKGAVDYVSYAEENAMPVDVYEIQEQGSHRRCGGQGDVLAGSLGVAMFWADSRKDVYKDKCANITLFASDADILAAMVTRRSSHYAFQDRRRSMTTPDVIATIGSAFESVVDSHAEMWMGTESENEY